MADFSTIESEFEKAFQAQVEPLMVPQTFSFPNQRDQNLLQKINIIKEEVLFEIRQKYLALLRQCTGRNAICYYSAWVQRSNVSNPEYAINDNDINGFMNCVCKADKTKGLDLILQTPGGVTSSTESIVKYLRKCFRGDIRVIVPHLAMSAGTMIACAANTIVLGKESSLGPIDPQYMGVPAQGVLREFNQAKKEIAASPATIPVWQVILAQYRPTFVVECDNVIKLSKQLAIEWLSSGMFKKTRHRAEKSKKIVNELANHQASKIHDRHYDFDFCKKLGLRVISLEADQVLQDAVLSVHHSFVVSSYQSPQSVKYIESDCGSRYAIISQT
jgi:ATP-dependent protease ClpP protease subunit